MFAQLAGQKPIINLSQVVRITTGSDTENKFNIFFRMTNDESLRWVFDTAEERDSIVNRIISEQGIRINGYLKPKQS